MKAVLSEVKGSVMVHDFEPIVLFVNETGILTLAMTKASTC